MKILGIETTCDETGIAVVENGKKIIANYVASSADLQAKYGGVIPEIAAREQVKDMTPLLLEVEKKIKFNTLDAISVAYGPGLIGSLLIGVEVAKTIAIVLNKPLIAVNHLIGHVCANWIGQKSKTPQFPLIALIVSGGHTDLLLVKNFDNNKWLGGTRDDAAGEAFDKAARVLGLSYPGGPEIDRVSKNFQFPPHQNKFGTRRAISNFQLTRPMINENNYDFSFSGIKTQVANFVSKRHIDDSIKSEIAYEFQEAVCDVLVTKTIKAARNFNAASITVSGGVAANERLREKFKDVDDLNVYFPSKVLSVDNGAMIGAAAFFDQNFVEPLKLRANASLHF